MAKGKLTKRLVEATEARPEEYVVWDTSLPRFGLKVSPSGHKTYVVKYRHLKRQRKLTVAPAGVMTPDQAREAALNVLSDVAKGSDPARVKRVRLAEPTVSEAFAEFLAEHVEARRKPRTAEEYERLFRTLVSANLGQRRITDVAPRDMVALHTALRKTPCQANRVIAVMSKFFNWCESPNAGGLRPQRTNPCHKIERNRERSRERFLSPAELQALGGALKQAEAKESLWAIAAIRLLIFTGARRNEILRLRWEHVDLERRRLTLPDSKTGAKVIILAVPAVEVLKGLDALRNARPSPWVVQSPRDSSRPFVQLQSVWARVRKAAGLHDLRLHDLRHSFASVAAAKGTQQHLIKAMLGHSNMSTTARYMHYSDDPLRDASDEVAAHIAGMMQEGATKVVPFRP